MNMKPPEYLKSNFIPRSYQLELLSKSKKKNTIAFLNTGTGKTYIAILLIKEKAKDVYKEWDDDGKRTFFIVNSVPLVIQQGNYIKEHTDLNVGQYTGAMSVDYWKKDQWNTQFRQFHVLVMTAQIFLNILNHGFLKLSRVNLIIFDECHHAIKNHPYKKIMELVMDEEFCEKDHRPHILGLTASVINNKCPYNKVDENVKKLELVLNSSVETSENYKDIYRYSTKPKEILYIFQLKTHPCHSWLDKNVISPLNIAIDNLTNFSKRDRLTDLLDNDRSSNRFGLHVTVLKQLLSITLLYGPWCCLMAARIFNRDLYKMQARCEEVDIRNAFSMLISLVTNIIIKLNPIVKQNFTMKELILLSTTKLQTLIKILEIYALNSKNFADSMQANDPDNPADKEKFKFTAIIFVETRFTAILLNLFLNTTAKLSEKLSFIKSGYIIGHGMQTQKKICQAAHMLHKGQQEVLSKFRQGEINVLVGTKVVEEGIDIPKCNLVIRFDLPQNFRSYVQSKGRARAENSHFILMVADACKKNLFADLRDYARIEMTLNKSCVNRDGPAPSDSSLYHKLDELLPPYQPEKGEGKPRVTLTSAIALVNWYCSRLPSDAYTSLYPRCKTKRVDINPSEEDVMGVPVSKFQTTIKLPINSVLKMPIVGQPMECIKTAQMAAALKCCEMLHTAGELNDHLLPLSKECYMVEKEMLAETVPDGAPLPGSTKRKQIYFKKIARCLKSALPKVGEPCSLYELQMFLQTPTPDILNTHGRRLYYPERYSKNLAILTRNSIPLIPQFPVYTRAGEVVITKKLICSNIVLTKSQLDKLISFHQYIFERVIRLKSQNIVFDATNSPYNILVTIIENGSIDYSFIDYVFEKESIPLPDLKNANRSTFQFKKEDFSDKVVTPIYRHFDTPIYFFVAEILETMNPLSSFPGNGYNFLHSTLDPNHSKSSTGASKSEKNIANNTASSHDTFESYYKAKYGIDITNKDQYLLDVDHTVGRLNLLAPRFMTKQGTFLPASSTETKLAKRMDINQKQILVPELCLVHPFDTPLWHKTVCVPTILHRLNYFLVCDELRQILARDVDLGPDTLENLNTGDYHEYPTLDFGWKQICQEQLTELDGDDMEIYQKPEAPTSKITSSELAPLGKVGDDVVEEVIEIKAMNNSIGDDNDVTTLSTSIIEPELSINKQHDQDLSIIPPKGEESVGDQPLKEELIDCNKVVCNGDPITNTIIAPEEDELSGRDTPTSISSNKRSSIGNGGDIFVDCSIIDDWFSKTINSDGSEDGDHKPGGGKRNISKNSVKMGSDEKISQHMVPTTTTTIITTDKTNEVASPHKDKKDLLDKMTLSGAKTTMTTPKNVLKLLDNQILTMDVSNLEMINSVEKLKKRSTKITTKKRKQIEDDPFMNIKNWEPIIISHSNPEYQKRKNENPPQNSTEQVGPFNPFSPPYEYIDEAFDGKDQKVKDTSGKLIDSPVAPPLNYKNILEDDSDYEDTNTNFANNQNFNQMEIIQKLEMDTLSNASQSDGDSFLSDECFSASESSIPSPPDLSNKNSESIITSPRINEDDDNGNKVISHTGNVAAPASTSLNASKPGNITNTHKKVGTKSLRDSQTMDDILYQDDLDPNLSFMPAFLCGIISSNQNSKYKNLFDGLKTFNHHGKHGTATLNNDKSIYRKFHRESNRSENETLPKSSVPPPATSSTIENNLNDSDLLETSSHDNSNTQQPQHEMNMDPFGINSIDDFERRVNREPLAFTERDPRHAVFRIHPSQSTLRQKIRVPRCPDLGLLLRAITMSTSNDALDLERLELIGDSFLKMAVTVYLFCTEPECHEGKLSFKRSKQVSNFKLYCLGKMRGFGEILISAKFEPLENWLAPGYKVISSPSPFGPTDSTNTIPKVWRFDPSKSCAELNELLLQPYDMRSEQLIPDKCLADCVESLIGAYLISCGATAALDFMNWLGIQIFNTRSVRESQKLLMDAAQKFQNSFDLKHKVSAGESNASNDSSLNLLSFTNNVKVITEEEEDDIDRIWVGISNFRPVSPLIISTPNYSEKLDRLFPNLERFQKILNYKFRDPAYLIQALTHSSYGLHRLTDCYQRLEFLGDALLDYLITRHLYNLSDRFTPGQMTDLRSALVNNIIFASLAVKFGFHKYLLQCSAKLFGAIDRFVKVQREKTTTPGKDTFNMGDHLLIWSPAVDPKSKSPGKFRRHTNTNTHGYGSKVVEEKGTAPALINKGGGANHEFISTTVKDIEVPKVLGDIFESVAGAIFMDSGMSLKTLWRIYSALMKDEIAYYTKNLPISPIRELLESEPERIKFMKPIKLCNGQHKVTVEVFGKGKWSGIGTNPKLAKCTAAKTALYFLKQKQKQQGETSKKEENI